MQVFIPLIPPPLYTLSNSMLTSIGMQTLGPLLILLVLVISTSSYESITYYHGLPYLLPTCFSFIAAL